MLNKWDAVPESSAQAFLRDDEDEMSDFAPLTRDILRQRWPEALFLSARTGEGLAELSQWLSRWLDERDLSRSDPSESAATD